MLPSSIFASEVEEKIGMLNKAAPQSGNIQLLWNINHYKNMFIII